MKKKYKHLPSPDDIDKIIVNYKIEGEAKNILLALKESLCCNISDKNGVLVEMDKEAFKEFINNKT